MIVENTIRRKLNSGKVVAVGPGYHDKEGKLVPVSLKEGKTVLLPEYGGTEVKLGEKRRLKMSFLRNAVPRKAHKERAQPHSRKKYGLLEKHKDYVQRARAYQQKQQTIQKLKEKAAFRNPDEFYFKMIKTRTVGGVHRPKIEENKYTPEELMLMKTQDIGYILQKLQVEKKKIKKLNSMLLSLDNQSTSKHVSYAEDRDEAWKLQCKYSSEFRENPSFEGLPKVIKKKLEASYRELEARKSRVKELEKSYADMTMPKELQVKKRKLHEDEIVTPSSRPVYKWRQERKR